MNLLQLNLSIFQTFYNSFLGKTSLNNHQKTMAVPRYSYDTVFHLNCLIQMFLKTSLSKIFIFCSSSFG